MLSPQLPRTLFFALLILFCNCLRAQTSSAQEIPPIKVDVQLVSLTATVEDRDGHAVAGLSKDAFTMFEDGIPQKIAVFHNDERVPVSIGVLFDTSGSMVDKIEEIEDAVLHFIDTTSPEDDIFLIKFSFHADLVEGFTSDRQRLRRAIGRLRAGGGTALYEAIVEGLQHLQGGRHKKKALLVITDGNDTTSNIGLEEAMETAKQSEAVIYALGIGHGEYGSFGHLPGLFKDVVDVGALKSLTDATGGRTVLIEGAHRRRGVDLIDKAAQGVSAELRNQYTLGYYPKNKTRDGSYRRIRVTLRQPGMVVRTRSGYFAPHPGGS